MTKNERFFASIGLGLIYSKLHEKNHVITYTNINIWDQKVQNFVFYEAFRLPGPPHSPKPFV